YYDHPGVAVVASAGDAGYGVEFPASAPDVTAVGGTSLTRAPGTARGWTEAAWSGTGSGCSGYEPKPSFQTDTGCAGRTVADVSAVANPDTGVAVYDTYSDGAPDYGQGWGQYGGTSVASPVITATYALGGPIASGDYPNADPYAHTSGLNDVTSGSNGTCSPAYLCTAGPGYDGPTGLGTPEGTGAFSDTSYGTLTGTIASATGRPVADAQIRLTGAAAVTTTTQADGSYRVRLPAGDYSMAVSSYGYAAAPTASGVSVTTAGTTVRSVKLRAEPWVTVSGTVTDGSGQGWPVQSTVLLDYGTGAAQTSTDPITGRYSLRVPGDSGYQVQVTPELTGYQTSNTTITVGATDATRDFTVGADLLASEGSALGYQQNTSGTTQTFADGTLPSGWSSSAASGTPWGFIDAADWSVSGWPSGTGVAYAVALGDGPTDISLYTAPVSVAAGQSPLVSFYSNFGPAALGEVDITTNGGTTWQTEWSASTTSVGQFQFTVPSASSAQTVQLRFRLQGPNSDSDVGVWLITDVRLGAAWLTPTPGGLVEGHVTDASTGTAVDGANVAVTGQPESTATTAPVTGPGDGFYYLFAPAGRQAVTAAQLNYGTAHATADVTAGTVTRSDFAMSAGRLAVHGTVKARLAPGGTATRTLTLTNTGSRPATFSIDQFPGTNASGTTPATTNAAITPAGTTAASTSAQRNQASEPGPATVRA
ncbi:MAG: carboxypeptidase regulatory-like domain-containing protein, partial [Trebonia sp.]